MGKINNSQDKKERKAIIFNKTIPNILIGVAIVVYVVGLILGFVWGRETFMVGEVEEEEFSIIVASMFWAVFFVYGTVLLAVAKIMQKIKKPKRKY